MRNLRRLAFIVIIVALALALIIFVYKRSTYRSQSEELQKTTGLGPFIQVATAKLGARDRTLSLIGEARPYTEVTLFAKVSGYLKEIHVDKGDHVKKGQLIARIEAPETDKDYAGASAEALNKRAIANRMKNLHEKNLISKQEAEQSDADARVSESRRDSTGVLKSYEVLRAPFDAAVTARYADAGTLVQAATSSATGAIPVVRLSDVERLRVLIYLDQKDASFVNIEDPVQIRVDEKPGVVIKAKVTRVTRALDSATRMLLAEVAIDNSEHKIIPGSFVHVDLVAKFTPLVEIPSEALVYQQRKHRVAVVENNIVHYKEVVVHANDGLTVQLSSGLKAGEVVALNVGSSLSDNSKVQLFTPRK